jgi:hypothetical protein
MIHAPPLPLVMSIYFIGEVARSIVSKKQEVTVNDVEFGYLVCCPRGTVPRVYPPSLKPDI